MILIIFQRAEQQKAYDNRVHIGAANGLFWQYMAFFYIWNGGTIIWTMNDWKENVCLQKEILDAYGLKDEHRKNNIFINSLEFAGRESKQFCFEKNVYMRNVDLAYGIVFWFLFS